jgi:hypothetical protein
MTFEFWEEYFGRICVFELEYKGFAACERYGKKRMEFSFLRVDGKAKSCRQAIRRDTLLRGEVDVRFGTDPCDGGAR